MNVDALLDDMAFENAARDLHTDLEEPSTTISYDSFEVILNEGEFLEVEWMGCENVFDSHDDNWESLSYVRMCKATSTKNASGLRVMPYIGWINERNLSFVDSIDDYCTKTVLTSPDQCFLDFSSIFKDDESGPDKKDL